MLSFYCGKGCCVALYSRLKGLGCSADVGWTVCSVRILAQKAVGGQVVVRQADLTVEA